MIGRRLFPAVFSRCLLLVGAATAVAAIGSATLCAAISQEPPRGLDKKLLDDLPPKTKVVPPQSPNAGGEDVGQPGQDHPLLTIAEQMREARRLLSSGESRVLAAAAQQRAADDLAKLIEALRRQQQQQAASSAQQQATAASTPQNQSAGTQNSDPAASSGDASPPGIAVGRDIWGHLPSRVREQIQSSAIEEFLPKYEELIEAYYRRLSED
jgi:hypothetical protein